MTDLRCVVCRAAEDTAFLCNRCTDGLERHLAELPSLFAELLVTETRQGRTYRAGGRSEREPEPAYDPEADVEPRLRSKGGRIALRGFALPYDEAAGTLRDECWTTVTTWARHLSETRGVEIPAPQRWPRRRTLVIERNRAAGWLTEWTEPTEAEVQSALCVWLVAHVDAVRMDEAAAEMVDEIADVHRRLTRAVDNSPERRYVGPCGADVVEDESDDVSQCERDLYADGLRLRCDGHRGDGQGCGTIHDLTARTAWFAGVIEDALAPISEWRASLPSMFKTMAWPNRTTWVRWVEGTENAEPMLYPHGADRLGRPLFRGGDVLALVSQQQARILGNLTRGKRAS